MSLSILNYCHYYSGIIDKALYGGSKGTNVDLASGLWLAQGYR